MRFEKIQTARKACFSLPSTSKPSDEKRPSSKQRSSRGDRPSIGAGDTADVATGSHADRPSTFDANCECGKHGFCEPHEFDAKVAICFRSLQIVEHVNELRVDGLVTPTMIPSVDACVFKASGNKGFGVRLKSRLHDSRLRAIVEPGDVIGCITGVVRPPATNPSVIGSCYDWTIPHDAVGCGPFTSDDTVLAADQRCTVFSLVNTPDKSDGHNCTVVNCKNRPFLLVVACKQIYHMEELKVKYWSKTWTRVQPAPICVELAPRTDKRVADGQHRVLCCCHEGQPEVIIVPGDDVELTIESDDRVQLVFDPLAGMKDVFNALQGDEVNPNLLCCVEDYIALPSACLYAVTDKDGIVLKNMLYRQGILYIQVSSTGGKVKTVSIPIRAMSHDELLQLHINQYAHSHGKWQNGFTGWVDLSKLAELDIVRSSKKRQRSESEMEDEEPDEAESEEDEEDEDEVLDEY